MVFVKLLWCLSSSYGVCQAPMVFVKLPKSVLGVFHLLWSNEVAIFLGLGVGSRVS